VSKIVPIRPPEPKTVVTTIEAPRVARTQGRSWLKALWQLVLMILIIGGVLLLGMLISGHERFLLNARTGLNGIKPYAVLLHWLIIAGVALFWQQLINSAQRRQRISEQAARALKGARNRIIFAMIVIEVVLVMGIPFRWI
jgi:membrane protein insertase Oxa1/YidC/SpoIIIJ